MNNSARPLVTSLMAFTGTFLLLEFADTKTNEPATKEHASWKRYAPIGAGLLVYFSMRGLDSK